MKHLHHLSTRPPAHQSGIVLFIALTAIAVMAFAALALMRSSGTSSTIAGNLSFQQAATQATDSGIELAYAVIQDIDKARSQNDSIPQIYSALQLVDDEHGLPDLSRLPTPLTWKKIPCKDPFDLTKTISVSDCSSTSKSDSGYFVRFFIDRQCTGTLPIADDDLTLNCLNEDKFKPEQPDSYAIGQKVFSRDNNNVNVLYRVTVQVLGPRGTESFVQAVLAF